MGRGKMADDEPADRPSDAPERPEEDAAAESPAVERPAAEDPAVESPATESPAESPATESPAAESPAVEEAKGEKAKELVEGEKAEPWLPEPAPPTPEAPHPLESLDQDSPARVRKTFIVLTAAAGVICLIPRQWVSSILLFVLALVVTALHLRRRRSET